MFLGMLESSLFIVIFANSIIASFQRKLFGKVGVWKAKHLLTIQRNRRGLTSFARVLTLKGSKLAAMTFFLLLTLSSIRPIR